MDVCESEQALRKHTIVETSRPRPPLVPAEKNHAVTPGRSRTREVSYRYKSPSPASPSGPRRCPSPTLTRTTTTSSQLVSKRAQSAERKRPSTPPSPSTPVHDTSIDKHLSTRRVAGGRLPESLWPSTMRSLSVSFQSDTISIPVSKKEKPVNTASLDRTLRPSSNVAHKQQVETPTVPRKPTPERKRSPLKGKNASGQSENSKPVDGFPTQLRDQHRWPSRIGGKVSSNLLNRSVDLADRTVRTLSTQVPGSGLPSLRVRVPTSNGVIKPLQKSASDADRLLSHDVSAKVVKSVDDSPLHVLRAHKVLSINTSDRTTLAAAAARPQSSPSSRSRPPSPGKASTLSCSITRGLSPCRSRPSTPPSRGVSPSRIRPTTSANQSEGSTSVLNFIADFKKGKKGATYIDDAHQLRLLYNRYLQWRFANARSEVVLSVQKATVERTLYNVWKTTLCLWDSVTRKRINLQQLKLELKLNTVLNGQMVYLDDWALRERDHIDALSGAMEDLEASTVRLPVTGEAKADIDSLKAAICSAVDVMQAMGSFICSLLSRAEGMNKLLSELAIVAAKEKAMLDKCEMLSASTAAMQVEECSLWTHLIQTVQAVRTGKWSILDNERAS